MRYQCIRDFIWETIYMQYYVEKTYSFPPCMNTICLHVQIPLHLFSEFYRLFRSIIPTMHHFHMSYN